MRCIKYIRFYYILISEIAKIINTLINTYVNHFFSSSSTLISLCTLRSGFSTSPNETAIIRLTFLTVEVNGVKALRYYTLRYHQSKPLMRFHFHT